MNKLLILVVIKLISIKINASESDYHHQSTWLGQCNSGQSQSPINVHYSYHPCSSFSFKIQSPQKRINVNSSETRSDQHLKVKHTYSTLTIKNSDSTTDYKSAQFHFHMPSEHHLNDKSFEAADQKYAVYGMVVESTEDQKHQDLLDHFDLDNPKENYITFPALHNVKQYQLPHRVKGLAMAAIDNNLAVNQQFIHYQGSLTTPLCTQGVKWFLKTTPMLIKKKNLQKLQKWLNNGQHSNRQVQPLNNRQIVSVGRSCWAQNF